MLIDKLTPNGQIPDAATTSASTSSMLEAGLDMLKGFGKNRHQRLS